VLHNLASGNISHLVRDRIDRQQGWLDLLAEKLQHRLSAAVEQGGPGARRVKDALNGTWLGHSLHPALTDVPIGAWFTSFLFDLIGEERGADASLTLGVIAAIPTAAAGLADWHDQANEPRRTGLVHALLNSAALVCFLCSIIARRSGHRATGIALSTGGLTFATSGAYLGGELVYSQGTGVDRNAWDPEPEGYQIAARAADLLEGKLTPGEIEVDGKKLPLVLLRKGGQILALGAVCSHVGGPLAEGKLVEGQCVECPWHGSTFDMQTGKALHGPSPYSQPAYDVREQNGNVEVRLRR
jgi:nitrite reductase/ring-hydroxylating ferredoxin subunit/uncharacterized membrane protein